MAISVFNKPDVSQIGRFPEEGVGAFFSPEMVERKFREGADFEIKGDFEAASMAFDLEAYRKANDIDHETPIDRYVGRGPTLKDIIKPA